MEKFVKQAIKDAASYEALSGTLKPLNYEDLTSSEVHLISKKSKQVCSSPQVKIAYLGNYTIEPLPDYVRSIAAFEEVTIGEYIGGYNQYFQEILDPSSGMIRYDPNLIYLSLSLRKLDPKFYYEFSSISTEEIKASFNTIITQLCDWVKFALEKTNATILISNFTRPSFNNAGIADIHLEYSETEFYLELNLELLRLFREESRVHIVDLDRLSAGYGKRKAHDPKLYYIAKMEWREQFLSVIAAEIFRYLKAIQNLTKKCLVLDLDNTLWGGIVGEDGPMGVKIDESTSEGEAFREFQRKIKTLKNRGIILAICSKNNRQDALDVFQQRPNMPLTESDFAALEINWNSKHENIKKIAATLNIGIDSIVFIDDNPAECSLVSQMLPDVKTILLPNDPATYPRLIEQLNDFEKTQILADDVSKTAQYIQNRRRQDSQKKIGDLKTYLESLETEITIHQATADHIPRIHQLFTKTNQFNLTTIRYSLGEVEEFIRSDDCNLTIVSAKDCFGELGMIALYLFRHADKAAYLDSFIMSCRAMGRGIETAIVNHIKDEYFNRKKQLKLTSIYAPTSKNKPAENFFEDQGFNLLEKEAAGTKRYMLEAANAKLLDCSWIKVTS